MAVPNGKLAPNLAKRGIQVQPHRQRRPSRYIYFNMDDPVVGGYTPDKVALRRAIGLAHRRRRARSASCCAARPSRRSRPSRRTPSATTRPSRARSSDYDPARAKALLDLYGYVDRDGDGWREQPDGSRWCSSARTQPDQLAAPVRRAVEEGHGRARHRASSSTSRKWPEHLKEARAGKLMCGSWRLVGRGPTARARWRARTARSAGGQNLARFKNAGSTRSTTACPRCPTGPSAWRCSTQRQADRRGLRAVQVQRAPHLTDLMQPVADRLPPAAVLAGVVARTSTSTRRARSRRS